jgi:hypothetical protein
MQLLSGLGNRLQAEADWNQKASATIHTKKFKRPRIFLEKAPYFDILYGRL